MRNNEPPYVLNTDSIPPSFLPSGLDMKDLIDITKTTDRYKVFMNIKTGEVHDGLKYFELSQK